MYTSLFYWLDIYVYVICQLMEEHVYEFYIEAGTLLKCTTAAI
jgi:hypothetical protein